MSLAAIQYWPQSRAAAACAAGLVNSSVVQSLNLTEPWTPGDPGRYVLPDSPGDKLGQLARVGVPGLCQVPACQLEAAQGAAVPEAAGMA
jgi:hypothetical protein